MTDPSTVIGGVQYHVTPVEVATASTHAHQAAQNLATLVAGIKVYVLGLEDSWQGAAALQFQQLMNDYDVFARMLNDALEGISSGLNGTYLNYRDSEIANLNSLQAIHLGAPPALFH